jgi:signal transduction histidine kinase
MINSIDGLAPVVAGTSTFWRHSFIAIAKCIPQYSKCSSRRARQFKIQCAVIKQPVHIPVAQHRVERLGPFRSRRPRRAGRRSCAPKRRALTGIDPALIGFAKVARDLSDRREKEAALESAMKAAHVANKAKSDFLANMSHHLPLYDSDNLVGAVGRVCCIME